MPDRPWSRFLTAFGIGIFVTGFACLGYGRTSAGEAALAALVVGTGLGLLAALGKRALAWIVNFIVHGGL